MINVFKYIEREDYDNLKKAINQEVRKEISNHPLAKPYVEEIKDNNKLINNLKTNCKKYY